MGDLQSLCAVQTSPAIVAPLRDQTRDQTKDHE